MLGKSLIKSRQRPDMTIAVEWDVKQQFKQTNKQTKHSCYIHAANELFRQPPLTDVKSDDRSRSIRIWTKGFPYISYQ